MSTVVLDCSVAMAWCFEDECDEYADSVLDALASNSALVPAIWPMEVANVLLIAERQKRLKEAESIRFVELLSSLPIVVEETDFQRALGPVLSLGRSQHLSSYDSAYLELAMRFGAPLATRDRALRLACKKSGVEVFS
jgi:predicted nucleic acid-binding protein